MSKENCGTCRFWKYVGGAELGDCRRHRPSVFSGDNPEFPGRFPGTFIDQWCGDYRLSDAARLMRAADVAAEKQQARLDHDYARALAPPPVDDDMPW